MIYIFTALYWEARVLIRQFDLTKNPGNSWPQEFCNEEAGIRLIITGVGEIAAAAAAGSICGRCRPGREDLLLNAGLCACGGDQEGIFLCNKITELATGRTFYPDMLYRQDFPEASLVTGMLPWNGEKDGPTARGAVPGGTLYDMEAAAIYQAGSGFFGPHQMMFLKIVSDRGAAGEVTKQQAEGLMEKYQEPVADYIGRLRRILQESGREKDNSRNQKEEELLERLSRDMHCSKAMRDSLREWIRYLTVSGMDCKDVIQDMYEKNLLPCKDKREGKLRFEEFKRRVL